MCVSSKLWFVRHRFSNTPEPDSELQSGDPQDTLRLQSFAEHGPKDVVITKAILRGDSVC